MPLVNTGDPLLWSSWWWLGNKHGVNLQGYSRALCYEGAEHNARRLIETLGLPAGQDILLVGAGFGWTAEHLERLVPGLNVVNIDTSSYIHSSKVLTETQYVKTVMNSQGMNPDVVPEHAAILARIDDGGVKARRTIHNEDISNGSARSRVKRLITRASYHWGVTDNVLPWLTDQEASAITSAGLQCCDQIAHLVTPFMEDQPTQPELTPSWNWKTIPDWKALLPNATIISLPTNETA